MASQSSFQPSQSSTTMVTPDVCFHWLLSPPSSLWPNVKLASSQLVQQPAGGLMLKKGPVAQSDHEQRTKNLISLPLSVLHPCPGSPSPLPPSLSSWLFSCAGNVTVLPSLSKLMQGSVLPPWTVPLSPLYDHQQDVFVGLPGTERCWLGLRNDAQGGREMPSIVLFFREGICCFRDLSSGQNLTSTRKLHPPNCFNTVRWLFQNM